MSLSTRRVFDDLMLYMQTSNEDLQAQAEKQFDQISVQNILSQPNMVIKDTQEKSEKKLLTTELSLNQKSFAEIVNTPNLALSRATK